MSIGRNTAIGLITDASVFGLGVVVSIVLTRSLGPEQRGVYALLVTTNVLAAQFGHLSVGGAFSTMLARGRYRPGEANAVAVSLALALGGAACVLLGGALLALPALRAGIFQGVPYAYLLVALALVPATIYQIYWTAIMLGLNRPVTLNKLNLAVNAINAMLIVLVVGLLRLGLPGFLGVWAFTAALNTVAAVVIANRVDRLRWPPTRAVLRDMLGFGLRGHGANIAHHLFLRFDVYAVNALVGTAGVGFYSLSTSLAEKLWIPINALLTSSTGKIAGLPHEESALLTARVARTALLMMLGVALPFGVVSPWLVPFLYGDEFAASVLPLQILLPGTLGFALMLVLNLYILGQMERPGLLSIIAWAELAISVPLYLVLISWLGIVGAAIASTLTYLLAAGWTVRIFLRDSGLKAGEVLLPRRADLQDYARVLGSFIRQGLYRSSLERQ